MSVMDRIRQRLLRRWMWMLLPPALVITGTEALRAANLLPDWRVPGQQTLQVLLFVAAASSALALPILYRAAFARTHRARSSINAEMYYRYANNSIVLSLLTIWISAIGSLLSIAAFYLLGIFLMSLYAAYTQYPSKRRITADARIFRVEA